MRKIILLLFLIFCFAGLLPAQRKNITLDVYAGSGLSWFGGKGAAKTSTYYISDVPSIPNSVDPPYGKKPKVNWLAGIEVNHFSFKNEWNFSLNAQYEHTGGKGNIHRVVSIAGTRDTDGEFVKGSDFISLNPQAGKIIPIGNTLLFVRAGVDYAIHLASQEEYTIPDQNDRTTITGYAGGRGKNDLRITANIIFGIGQKLVLDFGYKHGIRNYAATKDAAAYARMFHGRLTFNVIRPKAWRSGVRF